MQIRRPTRSAPSMTTGPTLRLQRAVWLTAPILGGCLAILAALTAAPARADVELGPTDGPRIYLSQACHNSVLGLVCVPNIGCSLYDENAGSAAIAREAANHFAARGYRVRIGNGTREANIRNSNAFGALIHVPIHSNAGQWDCSSTNAANGGTLVMHYGGPGDDQLANIMVSEIGPQSPGTSDRTQVRRDLAEITETRAHAAYLEAAYHTFGNDVAFLRNPGAWAWRIAEAVDRCLGRNGKPKECTW
jgi:hypothetical protein